MKLESMFVSLNVSASGLSAQRKKMDVISENIANINTTRTESGEPYRRQVAILRTKRVPAFEDFLRENRLKLDVTSAGHISGKGAVQRLSTTDPGIEVEVAADPGDFRAVYDPVHPDADEQGYVYMPNINIVSEMVEMVNASRAYEANLSSIEAAKRMAKEALNI